MATSSFAMNGECASRASRMTDPSVLDSRRLLGPSRILDEPGALLEVHLPAAAADPLIARWSAGVVQLLSGLGWPPATPQAIRHGATASLAFAAPIDLLLTATEVNEWAWAAALSADGAASVESLEDARARITQLAEEERDPRLAALATAAAAHQVAFLLDDDSVSIGMGSASRTFARAAVPAVSAIDWNRVRDLPAALVTGSNGKTTTVRLLAAMLGAEGWHPGWSSTDGVFIGGEAVVRGDYSGPEGARTVLRDTRVHSAVLETARGGILRRGLASGRATVAVVTNIAADHMGEHGVHDLAMLADVKLVVARAVSPMGYVILNADDALLAERASHLDRALAWFGLEPAVVLARAGEGRAAIVRDERLVLVQGVESVDLLPVAAVPITFGGAARYNLSNALGAALAAWCMGVAPSTIRDVLSRFGTRNEDNVGRAMRFEWKGATVLLDYAHNPHGMQAIASIARALPASRRAIVLGQAGNRDDAAIRGLARAAWEIGIDHVVLKEMDAYRRGREPGEISTIMAGELERLGFPGGEIERAETEVAAVERTLEWARPGDLLILTVHSNRDDVLALLAERGAVGSELAPSL